MNFKLGEAYVELTVKDAGYLAGLSKAESALKGLATRVSAALSAGALSGLRSSNALIGRMGTQASTTAKSMSSLASSIRGVTTAAQAMNTALGKQGSGGAAPLLKAQGQAQGSVIRAQGAAMAAQIRAGGAVAAGQVRAVGGAVGNVIRSAGGGAAGMIRSLAGPIRAVTQPLFQAAGRGLGGGGGRSGSMLGDLRQFAAEYFALLKGRQAFEYIRDTAIDLETRMMKLGRASGLTGDKLATVGSEFKRFAATNAGVDLTNVFELGTMGARLGIAGPQLSLFTRDVAKMGAVLDDIPAPEAAEGIARLISVFKRGPDEAIRFASALNKLDMSSTATARDILAITARMAPMAATLGMRPQQAMALAAASRQSGVMPETAGTQLGQLMGRMTSRRDQGQFARLAGQPLGTFRKTLGADPLKALTDVAKGIKAISESGPEGPQRAARALEKLHLEGARSRGVLLGLVRVLPELNQYVRASEKDWVSLDSIMKSFDQQGATTASQLKMMWNNVALLADKIGVGVLPAVKGFSVGVIGLTRDIARWVDQNKELFEGWGKNIGGFFRSLGALPRTWNLQLELIQLVGQEKMEQLIQIFKNTREPLIQTFAYLAETATAVFSNTIGKGARKAGVDFSQSFTESVLSNLEQIPGGGFLIQRIFGADAKTVRGVGRGVADAMKNAIDQEKFKLPDAPRFAMGDLFKNLPNRAGEIAAKRAEIQRAGAAQDRERNQEQADDEMADAQERIRASEHRFAQKFQARAFQIQNRERLRQRAQPFMQERAAREEFNARERWQRDNQIRMFRGQAPVEFEPRDRRVRGMAPGGGNLVPDRGAGTVPELNEVAKNTGATNDILNRVLGAIEDLNLGLV